MGNSKFLTALKKAASTAGDVMTTKGDILTRSASALMRLGVGSNGEVLTCASGETSGLDWSATAGLGSNVFTGSQTIPPNILKSQGIAGLGGLTFEPTATNATQNTCFNPSGTANRSQITISRQSDPTTNADSLAIGGDIYNTSKFAIRTYASGTGTARDLEFFHGTTNLMQLTSSGLTFSSTLNMGGNNIDNVQNLIHDISGGALTIDFSEDQLQTLTIVDNSTFTTSNRATGKSKTYKLINTSGSSTYSFTFPSWKFVGKSKT